MSKLDQHLKEVDESYLEHMVNAGGFGLKMMVGGLACLIHAVAPFACVKTGSQCITELHSKMVTHRTNNDT